MLAPFAIAASLILTLGACSRDEPPPPVPKLFAEQRDALDKTKDVSAMQLEAAEQQRKAMEQQTQ
ncbi:hypothetical protein [Sideroxydans sp.]